MIDLVRLLPVAVLLGGAGCGPKITDVSLPVIEVTGPSAHQQFLSGDTLVCTATFTDNHGLLSYTLIARNNFEAPHKTAHPIDPFVYSASRGLTGAQEDVEVDIVIPVDVAAGNYILTVQCTDAVGNDAFEKQVPFIIKNSTDLVNPVMDITSLIDSLPNNYLGGGTVALQGTITDNAALGNLEVFLVNASNGVEYQADLHLSTNPFSLDHSITAPLIPGMYTVELFCHDKVNNVTAKTFAIIVH